MSELGEVAKEVIKMSNYGREELYVSEEKLQELKLELGDVYYSLLTVANSFDVNMEDALDLVLEKYTKRLQKGSPGSENDN